MGYEQCLWRGRICSIAHTETPGLVFPEHPLEPNRTTSQHVAGHMAIKWQRPFDPEHSHFSCF